MMECSVFLLDNILQYYLRDILRCAEFLGHIVITLILKLNVRFNCAHSALLTHDEHGYVSGCHWLQGRRMWVIVHSRHTNKVQTLVYFIMVD